MWLQWLWKLNTQLNGKSSKKMSKSDGNWENKMWQTQKTLIFWKIWLTDFCNFLIQQPFYYRTIPWTVVFILVLFFYVVSAFRAFFPKAQHLYTVLSNWGCFPNLLVFYVFACFVNLQWFGLSSPSIRLRDSVSQSIFSKHLSPALRLKWDMYICSQGATREKNIKISRRNNLSECPHKCWMCSISPWETSSVCVRRLWLPYCCKNTSRKREGRGVEWRKERA